MFSEKLIEVQGECFIVDMMYAHSNNIMQCNIYENIGFENKAYVRLELWNKLQNLVPILKIRHQKLKIFDAYRPPMAHLKMLEIIPMKGFFAQECEHSLHCHGTAIDCCLTDENGMELAYPTKVDAYDPKYAKQILAGNMDNFRQHLLKAAHNYQNSQMVQEIANREELRSTMESIGLEAIAHEWWHYNLPDGIDYPMVGFTPE